MDREYQAHVLVEAGEKHLHPGCIASMCTSREQRQEQAKECYEKAGNMFKLDKKWFESGECYEKCGQICEAQQNQDYATRYFEDAVHCFSLSDDKKRNFLI